MLMPEKIDVETIEPICHHWRGYQICHFAAKFRKFGRISSWLAVLAIF